MLGRNDFEFGRNDLGRNGLGAKRPVSIYRIFEHGNAGLWTVEHISPDFLRDFSKELSALFASVNSPSPIIENGLLFGSLSKCLSIAALIEVSVVI